jgi:hypothetical protein
MLRIAIAGLILSASFAASTLAQDVKKATGPTVAQCQGGYKDSYMKSMKWSKADFDSACLTVMNTKGTKK